MPKNNEFICFTRFDRSKNPKATCFLGTKRKSPLFLAGKMIVTDFQDVYIASPPAEGGFLSILKEKFSLYGINVFIGLDLSRDLDDCYRLDSQVFSSIEQEICSKSTGFLYSPGSSWSLNTAIGKLHQGPCIRA